MTNSHEDDSNHLTVELSQSISDIKPGTSQKKLKSGEQNFPKQKLKESDIPPVKWPNFDSQNLYNQNTTIQPFICPFLKAPIS
jgi:hypothetical protein